MLSKAPETFKHPLILSFGSFADLFFDILAVEHRKTMTVFVKSSRPVMTIENNGGDVVVNTGMPEGFCFMFVCFNQQAPNSNEIISGDVLDRMKPRPKKLLARLWKPYQDIQYWTQPDIVMPSWGHFSLKK